MTWDELEKLIETAGWAMIAPPDGSGFRMKGAGFNFEPKPKGPQVDSGAIPEDEGDFVSEGGWPYEDDGMMNYGETEREFPDGPHGSNGSNVTGRIRAPGSKYMATHKLREFLGGPSNAAMSNRGGNMMGNTNAATPGPGHSNRAFSHPGQDPDEEPMMPKIDMDCFDPEVPEAEPSPNPERDYLTDASDEEVEGDIDRIGALGNFSAGSDEPDEEEEADEDTEELEDEPVEDDEGEEEETDELEPPQDAGAGFAPDEEPGDFGDEPTEPGMGEEEPQGAGEEPDVDGDDGFGGGEPDELIEPGAEGGEDAAGGFDPVDAQMSMDAGDDQGFGMGFGGEPQEGESVGSIVVMGGGNAGGFTSSPDMRGSARGTYGLQSDSTPSDDGSVPKASAWDVLAKVVNALG